MADAMGFRFSIQFDPLGIPRGFKDRFEAALRDEAVRGQGLDCQLGNFGGNRVTYGFIWRPQGDITIEDRQRFEEWLRVQPLTCKVALGDLEPISSADLNRAVTERVFELDQMSPADRQAAAAWRDAVHAKLPRKPG
jgi:hypothetical protein